jgi:DNA-binding PadR family transcriptional regulator
MNDLLLLATLLDRPKHGYALKKEVGLILGRGDMHNNLVYPLLKRFVAHGWVTCRSVAGKRGQTRELYSLSAKGKKELLARLSDYAEKEAYNSEACLLRVGLFSILPTETRFKIIDTRDRWLAAREVKLSNLSTAMDLGAWGGESVSLLLCQIRAERKWLSALRKKAARETIRKSD